MPKEGSKRRKEQKMNYRNNQRTINKMAINTYLSIITLNVGNSLAVQWLGLCALTAEGPGSIPGGGTNIPQAAQNDENIYIL